MLAQEEDQGGKIKRGCGTEELQIKGEEGFVIDDRQKGIHDAQTVTLLQYCQ